MGSRFFLFPAVLLALAAAQPAAAQATREPQVVRHCDTCPEMVVVPAGSYLMGTPAAALDGRDSPPQTQPVAIRIGKPFAIGRFEVTRGEFAEFVRDTGREIRPGCLTWDASLGRFNDDGRKTWSGPGVPAEPAERHPASCVSFADAQAYAAWLAGKTRQRYRLPSSAEWEYAARAGTASLRPWGDAPEDGCDFANTYDAAGRAAYRLGWANAGCSDGYADVAPVGQLRANAFGLHDMIGNLAEWVEDCAAGSNVGRPQDGRAWTWLGGCQRRVQRGGSWVGPPERARSGYQDDAAEAGRAAFVGFRVALDLEPGRGD